MKTLSQTEAPPDPEDQVNTSNCKCLTKFHNFFRKQFCSLGYTIGQKPSYFIIVPVFLTLLGLTGMQNVTLETDPEYLFMPTDGVAKYTRDTIERLFPEDSSDSFDPTRITRAQDFAKLLVTTKDNETILRTSSWDELNLLDELIQNLTIEWEDQTYNYSQICSKFDNKCFPNLIFNLNEIMYEVQNGSMHISYPVMVFPLILPLFYGGPEIDEENGTLISARGVYTTYFLAHDNFRQKERSELWQEELLRFLGEVEFEHIVVDRYASRSLTDEMNRNSEILMGYLPIAVILLFVFSLVSVSSIDWVRSKTQMAILGLFTIIMAVVGSFGALMYFRVSYVSINSAVPFLVLGIGLDDMYMLLSAWRHTRIQDSVPQRMAETYRDTAISVTITSLTTFVSFFVGTVSPFPGVQIFCIYLATSVLVTYIWMLTFFGACLAIVGNMEKNQRHVFSCKSVRAKSQTAKEPQYHIWCAGGINPSDPWNALDNMPSTIAKVFRDAYGKTLNLSVVKVLVIAVYLAYLGGAWYGSMHVDHGVDKRSVAPDGSYLTRYYEVEDELFRKFPYRIQVVVKGPFDFTDKKTQKEILLLHTQFENTTFIGSRLYTRSWTRGFFGFLKRRPALLANITDNESFINVLEEKFMTRTLRESLDVSYNENRTEIVAFRFVIQAYEVHNMEEDFEMVRTLREVADKAPFEVLVYHPMFIYYDQYLSVSPSAVLIVCLSAFILILITFAFIPHVISALSIGLSMISINFGVIGYGALWGVRLDTVALVNLIMCIGFSIDYSAHISYSFLASPAPTRNARVRHCLHRMGLPVLQSGISTILAIVVFVFTPSSIYRTFFKILFLVTIFGMAHSLVVLPVMLSLFDRKSKKESSDAEPITPSTIKQDLESKKDAGDIPQKPSRGGATAVTRECSLESVLTDKSTETVSSHSSSQSEEDSDDVESERL